MVAKEYKETTGVYKVQTFRTTHSEADFRIMGEVVI